MPDFTTSKWEFRLDGSDEVPEELKAPEPKNYINYLGTADQWKNYSDPFIYEADKAMRNWITSMCENSKWKRNYKLRRYTASMLFEKVFQKEYDGTKDMKMMTRFAKICSYYSSKISKSGSINGKMYSKSVYAISPKRLQKPPFSLRLRVEWLAENGELPTNYNMRLSKDDLKPGHARNPKTEENMRRRSERAKQRYRERYGNRYK